MRLIVPMRRPACAGEWEARLALRRPELARHSATRAGPGARVYVRACVRVFPGVLPVHTRARACVPPSPLSGHHRAARRAWVRVRTVRVTAAPGGTPGASASAPGPITRTLRRRSPCQHRVPAHHRVPLALRTRSRSHSSRRVASHSLACADPGQSERAMLTRAREPPPRQSLPRATSESSTSRSWHWHQTKAHPPSPQSSRTFFTSDSSPKHPSFAGSFTPRTNESPPPFHWQVTVKDPGSSVHPSPRTLSTLHPQHN